MRPGSPFARALAVALAASIALQGFAQAGASGSAAAPAPYRDEEFPPWARDLRRAEVVAFGALPFTVFFAHFAVDSYRFADHGWDQRYAPWPLKPAAAVELPEDQRIAVFAAGCAAAVLVAVVDHFLLKAKRRAAAQAPARAGRIAPTVETFEWPLPEPVVSEEPVASEEKAELAPEAEGGR